MHARAAVRTSSLTIAFVALLVGSGVGVGRSTAASTSGQVTCAFLTGSEAADAMGVPRAELSFLSQGEREGSCAFIGYPRKGPAAGTHLLKVRVYPQGLPGARNFAKAICKVSPGACKYGAVLVKERDPVRYMRLLYALADEAGSAVDMSNTFPGPGPAFLWEAKPPLVGTVLIFYVPKTKQFATTFCNRIYGKGGNEEDTCAFVSARNVYIEIAFP